MTDEELRALIRSAVARHLGGTAAPPQPPIPSARAVPLAFARYALPRDPGDTACIIEPAVRCDHCGYCQSHGH